MLTAVLLLTIAGAGADNAEIFRSRCMQANSEAVCRCAATRLQQTRDGRYFLGLKAVTSRPSAERVRPKADLLAAHGLTASDAGAAVIRGREAARVALAECRK